jgi:FkbM family methyltransferase
MLTGEYLHPDFLRNIEKEKINVIFEVGARDGNDSVKLSNYYTHSRVYSFECNPKTVNLCRETLKPYPTISFYDFGLGDVSETRTFYPYASDNPGASSFFKRIDYDSAGIENIKIETIENFCKQNGITQIDLLCMDTQGYELKILKGCGNILSTIQHIIIEEPRAEIDPMFLPTNLHSKYIGAPTHSEIQEFLRTNGFRESTRVFENYLEDNVMYSRM